MDPEQELEAPATGQVGRGTAVAVVPPPYSQTSNLLGPSVRQGPVDYRTTSWPKTMLRCAHSANPS